MLVRLGFVLTTGTEVSTVLIAIFRNGDGVEFRDVQSQELNLGTVAQANITMLCKLEYVANVKPIFDGLQGSGYPLGPRRTSTRFDSAEV